MVNIHTKEAKRVGTSPNQEEELTLVLADESEPRFRNKDSLKFKQDTFSYKENCFDNSWGDYGCLYNEDILGDNKNRPSML